MKTQSISLSAIIVRLEGYCQLAGRVLQPSCRCWKATQEDAGLIWLLAKEKGCPDLDSVLEDIKKQIIAEEFETTMMFLDHHDNNYDERDWMRDSWDAMTDGQYGDMPDGFDGDYDFLGY